MNNYVIHGISIMVGFLSCYVNAVEAQEDSETHKERNAQLKNAGFDGSVLLVNSNGVSFVLGRPFRGEFSSLAELMITGFYAYDCELNSLRGLEGVRTLKEVVIPNNTVCDLRPLRGLPLTRVNVSANPIVDLSPIVQDKLRVLDVSGSGPLDLACLKGCALERLELGDNLVSNFDVVASLPLKRLSFTKRQNTPVTAIAGLHLESLTINQASDEDLEIIARMPLTELELPQGSIYDLTPISNLKLHRLHVAIVEGGSLLPLKGMPLRSLSIGTSYLSMSNLVVIASLPITDLTLECTEIDVTPLRSMSLERLCFNPDSVTAGIEYIQRMPSLRALGVVTHRMYTPESFWQLFGRR